jgi:tRNA(Arg) A34 adenosine deaminase TadA
MNQFEFNVACKHNGVKDQIRATAHTEIEAYRAIYEYYSPSFYIDTHASAKRAPHAVAGEIDCS